METFAKIVQLKAVTIFSNNFIHVWLGSKYASDAKKKSDLFEILKFTI